MFASTTQNLPRTISVPAGTTRTPSGRLALAVVASIGVVALTAVSVGAAAAVALIATVLFVGLVGGGSIVALGDPAAMSSGTPHLAATTKLNFAR